MADKDRHETPRDPDVSNRKQPAGHNADRCNPSLLDGALFANHGRGGASGQRRHRVALDTRRCGGVSAVLHAQSPAGTQLARAFRARPADAGGAADHRREAVHERIFDSAAAVGAIRCPRRSEIGGIPGAFSRSAVPQLDYASGVLQFQRQRGGFFLRPGLLAAGKGADESSAYAGAGAVWIASVWLLIVFLLY